MKYIIYDCPRCKHYEWLREGNVDQCKLHGVLYHDDDLRANASCDDFEPKKKGRR